MSNRIFQFFFTAYITVSVSRTKKREEGGGVIEKFPITQGTNARKVISEVHAFFVLQCTVFGRKSKHKTDLTA